MFKLDLFEDQSKFSFYVFIIVVCALFLRLLSINPNGITFDESCSLRGSLGQKLIPAYTKETATPETIVIQHKAAVKDFYNFKTSEFHSGILLENVIPAMLVIDRGNGPLHYLQGYFWLKAFGYSDISARLNSLFFNLLSLVLLVLGTKRFFGPAIALMSGVLFALHPALVTYATEFRPYSFTLLFVLLATFTLFEFVKRAKVGDVSWKLALCYACFAACSFFSHYITAYIFFGHILFALMYLRSLKGWILLSASGLFVIFLFLLWMKAGADEGLKVMQAHSEIWASRAAEKNEYHLEKFIRNTIRIVPELFGLESIASRTQIPLKFFNVIFTAFKLLASLLIGFLLFKTFRLKKSRTLEFDLLLSIILSCFLYTVLTSISSRHFLAFTRRYLVFAYGFSIIAFSYWLWRAYLADLSKKWVKLLSLAFVAQSIVYLVPNVSNIVKNQSYNWKNRNASAIAADRVTLYDSQKFILVHSNWTVANMVNLYLPTAFDMEQTVREVAGNIVMLENKETKETILISSSI
jgi:uncharacterized membrane protein